MSRRHQLASITARLRASFAALLTNAGSQLPARSYLISLRVTNGEAITSTVILNEKGAPTTSIGALASISIPREGLGGRLASANQPKIRDRQSGDRLPEKRPASRRSSR